MPRAVPDAAALIDAEVREVVRRGGVDPVGDPQALRTVIDQVILDYADRALAGGLPALGDSAAVAKSIHDDIAGLGPLQRFLDDPEIEEIWVNGPGRVFVARRGRSELTTTILSAAQAADLVERMLATTGRRVDLSEPFVDAMLADGSRLHVVIPDVTRTHIAINLRKFVVAAHCLDDLVGLGTLTVSAARFLDAAVVSGLNVLVSGGTQSGKTTLLNCLAASIPARERVVSCEEVFELQLSLPDWVAMQTRQSNLEGFGELPLRRLVKEALRMRPDRLLVGEVRQSEALDLLISLNSGLPGMCTLHANSAREAVTKLCTLPLLAGPNVTNSFVVPAVATSVDLVVHIAKDPAGHRRLAEVIGLPGRTEGDVVETTQIYATVDGRLTRTDGYPPHPERFAAAGYDLPRLLGGESSLTLVETMN